MFLIDTALFDVKGYMKLGPIDFWSYFGEFGDAFTSVHPKGFVECEIIYWKSIYCFREKKIPEKVFFSFWNRKKRTISKSSFYETYR